MKQEKDFLQIFRKAVLLLPIVLAGCSDELSHLNPERPSDGLRLELQATIDQVNDTRADESGFADGDRFGLFVVNYANGEPGTLTLSGNQVNNVAMTYSADANTWQAATDIYWRDPVTPADVYGYYPFYNGISDVDSYSFEVKADQSVAGSDGEMGAYEASDLLWAKTAKATPGKKVELTFSHIMAGVKVVLQQGSGFDGDSWTKLSKTVTVDNTIRNSEVHLSAGTVTASGSFDRNIVMNPEGDAWRAVVVPQTVAAGKTIIGITIDGKPYAYTRTDGMKYAAGKLHNFTIKIDRKGDNGDYALTLVNEDITPWEADKSSHDFVENAYVTVHVAEAGTLKQCLKDMHLDAKSLRNLKVTGLLTDVDFAFMREEMSELTALNLKQVKLVNIYYREISQDGTVTEEGYVDDKIPDSAFLQSNSLRKIILPETLTRIGSYSFAYTSLTSTIIIPETVKIIEGGAFVSTNGVFTIILPNRLECIGESAFAWTSADINLNLPNTLKYIGYRAFTSSPNVSGTFSLPSELEFLGEEAFAWCGKDLDGEIRIPHKITTISNRAFSSLGFKKQVEVKFHDGVTAIEESAFKDLKFSAPLQFPDKLTSIGNFAFSGCGFVGELELPKGLIYLGKEAFSYSNVSGKVVLPSTLEILGAGNEVFSASYSGPFSNTNIEELVIGNSVEAIASKACVECTNLHKLQIGVNVAVINAEAFRGCRNIQTIVCLSSEPPILDLTAFNYLDYSHCVLEVPENSVDKYRNASGWNKFESITAHHELNLSISNISCLNKGITRDIILRAEGSWEISSKPDWVKVTPDRADYKEEIQVSVEPLSHGARNREGRVIFKLLNSDYTVDLVVNQYDYDLDEDKEILLHQSSNSGKAVPLFIVGEGYGAESIVSGEYLNRVNETLEHLFSIEPYKTYKDMFSIGTCIALSPDNEAEDILSVKKTKFEFTFPSIDCPMVSDLTEDLKTYVKNASSFIDDSNIADALIIMLSNYKSFAGSAYICKDGCIIACIGISNNEYPFDDRGLVQYWIGGAAFAELCPENIAHYDFIKSCSCPGCSNLLNYYNLKAIGGYENITLSNKIEDAPWKDFIFHPKYSSIVDMYEGGCNHLRGVWRSEAESVMSNYIPYYNTISRYAIYKRIMLKAGLTPTLEEFIENDKIEIPIR